MSWLWPIRAPIAKTVLSEDCQCHGFGEPTSSQAGHAPPWAMPAAFLSPHNVFHAGMPPEGRPGHPSTWVLCMCPACCADQSPWRATGCWRPAWSTWAGLGRVCTSQDTPCGQQQGPQTSHRLCGRPQHCDPHVCATHAWRQPYHSQDPQAGGARHAAIPGPPSPLARGLISPEARRVAQATLCKADCIYMSPLHPQCPWQFGMKKQGVHIALSGQCISLTCLLFLLGWCCHWVAPVV